MSLPEQTTAEEVITPEATPDVSAADSSPAPQGETNLVDAVLTALDKPEDSPASTDEPGTEAAEAEAGTPGQPKDDKEQAKEEGSEEDLTDKDLARLSEKTRNRIQTLLGERKENAEKAREREAEIERMKPEVEGYRTITSFMRENNLSAKDAGDALKLAALITADPVNAYQQMYPIVMKLAEQAGFALPPDLAADVKKGHITQSRAQELARARAKTTFSERQIASARERETHAAQMAEEQKAQELHQRHVHTISALGDKLAAEKAQTDPDWKLKESLVAKEIQIDIVGNGFPKDEAEMRRRFAECVKSAETYLKQVAPAGLRSVNPLTSTSSPAQKSKPPESVQEAVFQALGG